MQENSASSLSDSSNSLGPIAYSPQTENSDSKNEYISCECDSRVEYHNSAEDREAFVNFRVQTPSSISDSGEDDTNEQGDSDFEMTGSDPPSSFNPDGSSLSDSVTDDDTTVDRNMVRCREKVDVAPAVSDPAIKNIRDKPMRKLACLRPRKDKSVLQVKSGSSAAVESGGEDVTLSKLACLRPRKNKRDLQVTAGSTAEAESKDEDVPLSKLACLRPRKVKRNLKVKTGSTAAVESEDEDVPLSKLACFRQRMNKSDLQVKAGSTAGAESEIEDTPLSTQECLLPSMNYEDMPLSEVAKLIKLLHSSTSQAEG